MNPQVCGDDSYVQVTVELRQSNLAWLDDLVEEWGLRSRAEVVNRLLEVLAKPSSENQAPTWHHRHTDGSQLHQSA
jgi:Arc/MetJ-type ribon-helix-helix transcriptional regulator